MCQGDVDAETRYCCRVASNLDDEGVVEKYEQLRTYESDGLTSFRVTPALVVLPATTEEVQGVLRICHREHIAFVPRGSGTGLSGGALPIEGGVVISLARRNEGAEHSAEELAGEILRICVDHGGSITGEHGVGIDKKMYMKFMFTEADMATHQLIHCAIDPQNLSNPNKLYPMPRLCGEVPGPYRQHPLEAVGVIDTFVAYGLDTIVVNVAGCGSSLKEYGHLLRDDPEYAERAKAFSASVRDITELLAELTPVAPRLPELCERKFMHYENRSIIQTTTVSSLRHRVQQIVWHPSPRYCMSTLG